MNTPHTPGQWITKLAANFPSEGYTLHVSESDIAEIQQNAQSSLLAQRNALREALECFVRCTNSTELANLIPADLEQCNHQARQAIEKAQEVGK